MEVTVHNKFSETMLEMQGMGEMDLQWREREQRETKMTVLRLRTPEGNRARNKARVWVSRQGSGV